MISQLTDVNGSLRVELKGVVAADAIAFLDTSNMQVSATPTTNGGIVGISASNDGTNTVVEVITPGAVYEVDEADVVDLDDKAADITAKKTAYVYVDGTANGLTVVSTSNGNPVGMVIGKTGTKYNIVFKQVAGKLL